MSVSSFGPAVVQRPDVLERTLAAIETSLDAAVRVVLLAEHVSGHLAPRLILDLGLDDDTTHRIVRLAEGVMEAIHRSDHGVVLAHAIPELHRDRLVAVPVTVAGDLVAVIVAASHTMLTDDQLAELRAAVDLQGTAVSHLLDRMRADDREYEAELLVDVTRALVDSSQLPKLVPVIARSAAIASGFARATVLLWRRDGELLAGASQFATGQPDLRLWGAFRTIRRPLPAMRRVLETGEPYVSERPEEDRELEPERWVRQFGVKTVAVVPFSAHGGVTGVVVLDSTARSHVTPDRIQSAARVAAQGGHTVALSQLVQEERTARQRSQLVLGTVVQASTQLNTSGVLSVIADGINAVSGDATTVAFVLERGTATKLAVSGHGEGTVDLLDVITAEDTFDGDHPLHSRRGGPTAIVVGDDHPRLRSLGVGRVLVVPVRRASRDLGWVVSFDRRSDPYLEDDLRVIGGIAAQAALSLHTARLLEGERAAVARLEELDRLKTAFVAAVSHELRTPLTAIVGFSEILMEQIDDPVARDFIRDMRREASVLEALIGNLLDTSRLEAGMLQLNRRDVDLLSVAREAVDVVAHGHPSREFRLDLPDQLEPLYLDSVRLRQVFVNLVENAAKYSPAPGPITFTVDPAQTEAEEPTVAVHVDDEGPGIPPSQRDAVFQRFHRLSEQSSKPGTGIGLYLVRALVDAHGGTIEITDNPVGRGARFTVTLPAVRLGTSD